MDFSVLGGLGPILLFQMQALQQQAHVVDQIVLGVLRDEGFEQLDFLVGRLGIEGVLDERALVFVGIDVDIANVVIFFLFFFILREGRHRDQTEDQKR